MRLANLTRRIAGLVTRVDHTGVNLPSRSMSTTEWTDLVRTLAATATMYRYPTGLRDFVVGREPRFELVYRPAVSTYHLAVRLMDDTHSTRAGELVPGALRHRATRPREDLPYGLRSIALA